MTGAEDCPESDPGHHTQKVQGMFETAAEVLLGLKKAFADCEEKEETAWE